MSNFWTALLLFGLFTQANDGIHQQAPESTAEARLTTVKLFAFGGIGFAGVRSRGEQDYREVMSRPDRLHILERVLDAGTPEAKAFALVGIYRLRRDRFLSLASSLRASKDEVRTARGCIIGRTTLGKLVQDIAAGTYVREL